MTDKEDVTEKRITMKDIAKHLNIDRTTVSKALAENPGLSPEMIERVKNAAKELGYRKDPFASGLTTGKNAVLGIVLSEEINRGIYASFIKSFQHAAKQYHYAVIIYHVGRNQEDVLDAIQLLKQQRVSGVTFVARANEAIHDRYIIQLANSGVAINVTGTRRLIHHNIDSIIFDHEKAGYDLTSYLIQLGHKQIVLVSYPGKGGSLEERTQGYLQAMRDSGLTPSVVEVPSYSSTRLLVQDTYRFIKNIWGSLEQVSACIGINDDSALGILFALKELGVSVPDKVSVAGFDDSNAVLGVPQLTTMRLPLQQEGETAGRLLSERIATIEKIATCTTLECEMVVRESTGPFQG